MEERENVVSRTIKIVIGCILAVLYLVPIIMLLSAAFKTQKNIFKDIFGFRTLSYGLILAKPWHVWIT